MDGVLVDFDTRFKEFSGGIEPQDYVDQFGLEKFWELIDEKVGVRFWVGMDWMSDGLTYWDYIKKYKPILLSAPSRHKHSQIGKRMFAKKHLPTSKLILALVIEDGAKVAVSCNILPRWPSVLKASPATVPSSNPI